MNTENEKALSEQIENLLVERNLRGMKNLKRYLCSGYCLRAAKILWDAKGVVLIGTGFPVLDTFETDGPVGALVLYHALEKIGATPILVCATPIANAFKDKYRVYALPIGDKKAALLAAKKALLAFKPKAVIAIECPGITKDGNYYNMRRIDISEKSACFDFFLREAQCPTIAIGDGGNEIGMGNVKTHLAELDITPSITTCDELIISDVSNWGVYGILAFLSCWSNEDLLNETCPVQVLKYISQLGSIDGVTHKNELTEDSLPASEGVDLIAKICTLLNKSANCFER